MKENPGEVDAVEREVVEVVGEVVVVEVVVDVVVETVFGEKDPNLTKLRFLSVVDKVVLFSTLQPPRKEYPHLIRYLRFLMQNYL